MKTIFITLACFVPLSSYGGDMGLPALLQTLPPIQEGAEFAEEQTSTSVSSGEGYHADHEPLFSRDVSYESVSDASSVLSVSPIQTRHIVGAEMFLHNGNLIVSFPDGVWVNFSKVIICQNDVMMDYQRKQTGSALIYPETDLQNDEN